MMFENRELQREISRLKKILERKETIERAITSVAVDFVFPSNLDIAIDHALKELLRWSGVDRVAIFQLNPDNENLYGVTHELCKFGVIPMKRFAQNITVDKFNYFERTQKKQGYIAITDTKLLPADAIAEINLYKKSGVRASATCSFTSRKKFGGLVGLFNRKPIKEWRPEILQFLTSVAIMMEHSFERLEAEKRLIAAKELAEENERIKTIFMANLSHEIRTPLNGILGFSKLLIHRTLTEEKQKQYAGVIEVNSRQLLSIVDDLLDISKIESGVININTQEFSINDLLKTIYEFFKLETKNKDDIIFSLEVPDPEADIILKTDPSRLKQVLDNIIKNAIKFTPSGQVRIGYFSDEKLISLYIADTGIGINKADLKNIFSRFWQFDPTIARPYVGNGIGLSITKDLAKLLGGKITVDSNPGEGTKFIIELPYRRKVKTNSDL